MGICVEHNFALETKNGYLCIANSQYPFVLGGIRMIPDVGCEEVCLLAESMEYKLASFGIPIGGAKAGIRSEMMSLTALSRFLEDIRLFLIGEVEKGPDVTFITGPDMGTSEELYFKALRSIGLGKLVRKGLLSSISRVYGLPMDNIVTGFGVVVATEEIFGILSPFLRGRDPLEGKTYALEGFGKVATGIARLLKDRCKLVAVSTIEGMVHYDESSEFCRDGGFDIEKLIALKEEYGDKFVYQMGTQVLPPFELYSSEVDFIIPGARTHSITKSVAEQIISVGAVKALIPASNSPYTEEGLAILEKNGIICCPDFLSNPGAVLAAMVEFTSFDITDPQEAAMDIVHRAISLEMRDLLTQGIACGCAIGPNRNMKTYHSLYKLAIERALKRRTSTPVLPSIQAIADEVLSHYSIL